MISNKFPSSLFYSLIYLGIFDEFSDTWLRVHTLLQDKYNSTRVCKHATSRHSDRQLNESDIDCFSCSRTLRESPDNFRFINATSKRCCTGQLSRGGNTSGVWPSATVTCATVFIWDFCLRQLSSLGILTARQLSQFVSYYNFVLWYA